MAAIAALAAAGARRHAKWQAVTGPCELDTLAPPPRVRRASALDDRARAIPVRGILSNGGAGRAVIKARPRAAPPPAEDKELGRPRRDARISRHDSRHDPGSRRTALTLCVYAGAGHGFRTAELAYDTAAADDAGLWAAIRNTYRGRLQGRWRRWVLFKRLHYIAPVKFTSSGVPRREADARDTAGNHELIHCYHRPGELRSGARDWVEWFDLVSQMAQAQAQAQDPAQQQPALNDRFRREPDTAGFGLEFVEGLWAEKLAALALILTTALVATACVWAARGGNLETIFTVLGFTLTLAAAWVALVALYYQITLPG